MWWDHQNLNAPRRDKAGVRWNFRVWHDIVDGVHVERVFFWNDAKEVTGMVELRPGIHISKIRDLIEKLVANPALRELHSGDIRFPLERHYSVYEPFNP